MEHPVWPFDVLERDHRPRGDPEFLERALERLGLGQGSRDARDQARHDVDEIARRFHETTELNASSPRVGDAVRRLKHFAQAAREFCDALVGLDGLSAEMLNVGLLAVGRQRGMSEREVAIALHGQPSARDGDFEMERLQLLAEGAAEGASMAATLWGTGDVERPDAGGNSSMFAKRHGHPKYHLVSACLWIFDRYLPGQASAYDDGPFFQFVNEVYMYATGREADTDRAGLPRWIRYVRNHRVRCEQWRAKAEVTYQRYVEVRDQLTRTDAGSARQSLEAELRLLEQERCKQEAELDFLVHELDTGETPDARIRQILRICKQGPTSQ